MVGLADHRFRLFKRIEDILVAGVAVVLLAPLFVVLAIGVKLSSPGPVLFRQKRHGLGGKEFWMLVPLHARAERRGADYPG